MAFTTPKMGLRVWNSLNDPYDHEQLADNWAKVDFHDHTPGRGLQIPTEGLFDGAVTPSKLSPTSVPWTTHSHRLFSVNGGTGGTLYHGSGAALVTSQAYTGVYLNPDDFALDGEEASFRIRASAIGSSAFTGGNLSFQLLPSAGISNFMFTGFGAAVGTAVIPSSSTNTVDYSASALSDPFAVTTPGWYGFGVKSVSNFAVEFRGTFELQVRGV